MVKWICCVGSFLSRKEPQTWAKILKENNSEKGLVSEKTVCTMPVAEIIAVSVRNAASRPFQKPRIGDRNSSISAYILKVGLWHHLI